jgi:glycosyltransferase involved in cell wall biosynthesis
MEVSVIIPVYNAASYVSQAVQSCLMQPETAEIILIEDGSSDNSRDVCRKLADNHGIVRLFHHPNFENRGAGASRNLGMKNSSYEYLAFLDADDYFLPGRLSTAKKIFQAEPDCEGVYEATGMFVEDEVGLKRWKEAKRPDHRLKTLTKPVDSDRLGEALISGEVGHFSLDGLVLKKGVLNKSGYMDEGLKLHQDTNFIIRVSLVSKLLPGRLDRPVTMWRVHDHNRISAPRSDTQKYDDRMAFWMATYRWCKARSFKEIQKIIINKMILDTIGIRNHDVLQSSFFHRVRVRIMQLFAWLQKNPDVLVDPRLWHSLSRLLTSKGRDI